MRKINNTKTECNAKTSRRRATLTILACVTALLFLCGCGGNSESSGVGAVLSGVIGGSEKSDEKAAVSFVIGSHANSRGLNMNGPLVQDTVYDVIRNYGYLSVISVDGNPEAVCQGSCDIDEKYKGASDERLEMDARSRATSILNLMTNTIANEPEADYLKALQLAVRTLTSLTGYDSKTIIVIGTGVGTTGVLNLSNNLISADPTAIVALLAEQSEIPDFTGMTVYFQQLGDVSAPQKELTSAQKLKLREIYKGIVEAGGGTFVCDETIPTEINTTAQYPEVTPVDFPDATPIAFEPETVAAAEAGDGAFAEPVVLSEEQVGFIGDSSEYLNATAAMETLEPIAEYLIAHPEVEIILAGTTAGDKDSDSTMKLSLSRAEQVSKSLTELGVDAARITAVGLGSTKDPWHVYGVGCDSAASSANRKVVLMSADSEAAALVMEQIG